MPTYEYVCKECGEGLEVVQSFDEPGLTTCATCGGPLRKVFGNVGIVFKGSGFYKTDSRANGAGGTKAGGDKAPATSGEGTGADASGGTAKSDAPKEPAGASSTASTGSGAGASSTGTGAGTGSTTT